jgi:hypothetical protein
VYNRESGAASFDDTEIKFIGGKAPEFVFYQEDAANGKEKEVERVDIREFTTEQLDELLNSRGFRRSLKGEPVSLSAGVSAEAEDAVYRSVDPIYDTRDGVPTPPAVEHSEL